MHYGLKARKQVFIFHQWIVTTINNDLPNIVELMEEEEDLYVLRNELFEDCGKIAVGTALGENMDTLENAGRGPESQIQAKIAPFNQIKAAAKQDFTSASKNPVQGPHPYTIPFNVYREYPYQYQNLTVVQRHKFVGTYFSRRKKIQMVHNMYNQNYNGGVRVSFISQINDPCMNQNFKFHLQSWMENCDLHVMLDEEQAIR